VVDPVQAAELLVSRLRLNVLEMRAAGAASDQDAREVAAVFSTLEALVDECKSLRLLLEQTRQEREAQAATVKELKAENTLLRDAMPSDEERYELGMALDSARNDRDEARAKLAEFSRAKLAAMHRRAQRAESATADARREAIGQRKRADWWRREAKRLGWTPDYPELREEPTSDARIDCESSSILLLSTWARKVMMRPKNRAKGVPTQSILELLRMAWHELSEARWAITDDAPTDDILAELGEAAACISFAMREVEKRRKA